MIDNDPRKSLRSITRDMGECKFLIRRVVHDDNLYFSSKMRDVQFLLQAMKYKREDRDVKILNKIKHTLRPNMFWFFSDEKYYRQDQEQNNRYIALSPQDLTIMIKTKRPKPIMMSEVATNDSDVMPPFISPHDFKLNTETYIKCLEEILPLWIERIAAGSHYVRQENSAPCYKSRRTQ